MENPNEAPAAAPLLLEQVLHGLRTARQAVALTAQDPYVLSLHKRILLPLLALAVVLYFAAVLPLRFLFWLLRLDASRVSSMYSTINRTLPFLISLVLRFVWYAPLDRCYLSVLAQLDKPLADSLAKLPPRSGWEMAKSEAKRLVGVVLFLPIYYVLSWIPLVGRALKFLFKVCGSRRHWGKRRSGGMGTVDRHLTTHVNHQPTHQPTHPNSSTRSPNT